MRLVWVLVCACLVAVAGVRPLRAERRDPHTARVDVAPVTVAVVGRRQTTHVPDLRLAAFIVAETPSIAVPVMVALGKAWQLASPAAPSGTDTYCARGPPDA
ncbi:MAG TPA: hypothetical protein VIV11_38730 [Kofleriaceae bacterium]